MYSTVQLRITRVSRLDDSRVKRVKTKNERNERVNEADDPRRRGGRGASGGARVLRRRGPGGHGGRQRRAALHWRLKADEHDVPTCTAGIGCALKKQRCFATPCRPGQQYKIFRGGRGCGDVVQEKGGTPSGSTVRSGLHFVSLSVRFFCVPNLYPNLEAGCYVYY